MTPEQQNIAIAEALGLPKTQTRWRFAYWTQSSACSPVNCAGWESKEDALREKEKVHGLGFSATTPQEYTEEAPIPNFHGSLDACAQLWSRIPATDRDNYKNWLSRIVERERRMATIDWLCITATAPQHCEAFLRTLDLWPNPAKTPQPAPEPQETGV